MPEITPLGYLVIIVGCVIISATVYQYFFYDEHQQDPEYCRVYAQQHLLDMHTSIPYLVNERIAANSCTEPYWNLVCQDTPENRKRPVCWVARSEPKFQIIGVKT